MRILFRTEGGFAYFPGLSAERRIDADALTDPKRRALRRLIRQARFFDLPERVGVPKRCPPDCHRYFITVIDDEDRVHTIMTAEPVADSRLASLVAYLQALDLDDDD
ncbi:MAG: hypothetical protein JNL42_14515 [Anaerolineae bacterium]|nr:hypothetical protein [Anaerolineae bacterium]